MLGSSKGRRCPEGEREPGAEGDRQAGEGDNLLTRGLSTIAKKDKQGRSRVRVTR